MQLSMLNSINSIKSINYKSSKITNISRQNTQNDSYIKKNAAREGISTGNFAKTLQQEGLSKTGTLEVLFLLKTYGLDSLSLDIASGLSDIFKKEKDTGALLTALAVSLNDNLVEKDRKLDYINACKDFYLAELKSGKMDISLASKFAQISLKRPIAIQDLGVAAYLLKLNKINKSKRKLNDNEIIRQVFAVNERHPEQKRAITTNVAKLNAFTKYYFNPHTKNRVNADDAAKLAELSLSEENPYQIDEKRENFIQDLLREKINGTKLQGEEVVKFVRHLFNLDADGKEYALDVLYRDLNITTQGNRMDIDCCIEISKLFEDGFDEDIRYAFADAYGYISHINNTKRIPNSQDVQIASEIVRNIPDNLISNQALIYDIGRLYKRYIGSIANFDPSNKLTVSTIARIASKHFSDSYVDFSATKNEIDKYC